MISEMSRSVKIHSNCEQQAKDKKQEITPEIKTDRLVNRYKFIREQRMIAGSVITERKTASMCWRRTLMLWESRELKKKTEEKIVSKTRKPLLQRHWKY